MPRVAKRALQVRARQARTDLYREHILEVAEQVFAERGFESAKLQDIGRAAGVFVADDPSFLAKLFSAVDQVLLADWVAGGMQASRDALIARMRALVTRIIAA
jgi:hypothetical protein